MRSIRWIASGTMLGIALAGFAIVGGGPSPAFAQGMGMGADAAGKNPGQYRRSAPRAHRYYRPRRAKRQHFYRSANKSGSCGQFRYWHAGQRRCLDARTSPPSLK